MKKLIFCLSLIIYITLMQDAVQAKNYFSNTLPGLTRSQEELYKDSFTTLLYPYISQALNNYYGGVKQFDLDNARIISVKRPSYLFEFDITVQVTSFSAPHNPPYGLETVTIRTSPMGAKVVKFAHEPVN